MSDNPLFAGFMPVPVKENPFTGETGQPPLEPGPKDTKPPRKKRGRKVKAETQAAFHERAAKPKRAYKKREPKQPPSTSAILAKHAVLAPGQTLQSVFIAMKSLEEADYPVFEKLLGDRELRARVLTALKNLSLA